jgi:hypothetical protein
MMTRSILSLKAIQKLRGNKNLQVLGGLKLVEDKLVPESMMDVS